MLNVEFTSFEDTSFEHLLSITKPSDSGEITSDPQPKQVPDYSEDINLTPFQSHTVYAALTHNKDTEIFGSPEKITVLGITVDDKGNFDIPDAFNAGLEEGIKFKLWYVKNNQVDRI